MGGERSGQRVDVYLYIAHGVMAGELILIVEDNEKTRKPLRYLLTAKALPAYEENAMSDKKTLYERLGGYDAVTAVANDLLPRLRADPQLGRFWAHRGEDGVKREKQLLIDFLCASAGGPVYYRGREMALCHRGMRISESDWTWKACAELFRA